MSSRYCGRAPLSPAQSTLAQPALEAIKPHLFKGSVLVFDELGDDIFPGETVALREVFNLADLKIERHPMTARVSYVVLQ